MRQALAERLTLSEALELVGKLIERYPNGGSAAEKGYIGGLAAVLAAYPAAIARRCHDPLTGVPKTVRFLPTPADVIAWCEGELTAMRSPVDFEDRDRRLAREAAERRDDAERWEKLRASPAGEYVAKGLKALAEELRHESEQESRARRAAHLADLDRANRTAFARDCAAAGVDPALGVSPALLEQIRRRPAPTSEAAE